MADICITCDENLATVTLLPCGHRIYCEGCYSTAHSHEILGCPICRQSITNTHDTTDVQLYKTTLNDGLDLYENLRQEYPCGCLLFGTDPIPASADVLRIVKEAMAAEQASKLSLQRLKIALRRLSVQNYQLVFIELIKNEDLHGVLKRLDKRKFERRIITTRVREMVIHTIEASDKIAIGARAGISTVAHLGELTCRLLQNQPAVANSFGVGAIGAALTFTIFSAVELYRWSKGELTGKEVMKNIGEHAVGAGVGMIGGYLGNLGGAALGAALGSVVPGVGTVIGGVIGAIIGGLFLGFAGDAAGRWVYRKFMPREKSELVDVERNVEQPTTPEEVAAKAAEKFGINLDLDSFEEAHARFRRRLLDNHPDKRPDASEEEREQLTAETRDILACWLIVREYYKDRQEIEGSDCEEGFIKVFAYKVLDTASNQWKTVRTFFSNIRLGRDINPATEKLEEITIYV